MLTRCNEAVQILRTAWKAIETACERPSTVIHTILLEQAECDISSSDVRYVVHNMRAAMYRGRIWLYFQIDAFL